MMKSETWRDVIAAVITSNMEFDAMFEALRVCMREYETARLIEGRQEGE